MMMTIGEDLVIATIAAIESPLWSSFCFFVSEFITQRYPNRASCYASRSTISETAGCL